MVTKYMLATPVEGRKVRNPSNGVPIPKAGLTVQPNAFWNRRLKDGDITLIAIKEDKTNSQKSKSVNNS